MAAESNEWRGVKRPGVLEGAGNRGYLKALFKAVVERADEERIAQVAGSLTFTTVLSLVPLLTIIFAALSTLSIFDQLQDGLHDLLLQHLMPASVSDSIFRYLNQFVAKARGLTVVGLAFLAITAVSTMLTIDRALNTIWRVRHPRPLTQRVLVYWAILTVGPILLALSFTLTSYLASASVGAVNKPAAWVAFLIDFVPLVALTFAYAAMYVYIPNRPVAWRDALIGGLVGAIAFELAKRGFAVYIAHFRTYTAVYGALAALPIFLIWVYVSWLITLGGATVAASLPSLKESQSAYSQAPGQDFVDALRLLRLLYRARAALVPGLDVNALCAGGWLDLEHARALLEKLEGNGLVIRFHAKGELERARGGDEEVWMFAADAKRVHVDRLFRLFAYDGRTTWAYGLSDDDPLRATILSTPKATLERTLFDVLER